MNLVMLVPILFPVLAGALLPLFRLESDRKMRQIYVGSVVIINLLIIIGVIISGPNSLEVLNINLTLRIYLNIDKMSQFFVLLVSCMWLLVTFYVFEYIKHETNEIQFYMFYLMTMGVLVGLGFAGNFLTFYMFYELMTIISYGIAIHSGTDTAIKAGAKYLVYSFIGAALVLVGFVFVATFGTTTNFTPKGVFTPDVLEQYRNLLLPIFFITFVGFGGKAGMFPLHAWLPTAHPVAPAPASALLSGVITKAGVLGIIRVIYYIYGADFIRGSWAQIALMCLTLFTVFMGSMLAYQEKLLKKRLAYSTVSQVSYVLFGLIVLHPLGLLGALLHILFHSIIKNILFLAAGAIIYKTHKTYVYELKGIGKTMPIVMWCFAIASVSLVGIPPTIGVVSKWYLAIGAMESNFPLFGTIGAGILLISALLTAGYLISIAATAFFPGPEFDYKNMKKTEPNAYMTIPLIILSISCFMFGIFPNILINFFNSIVSTVF